MRVVTESPKSSGARLDSSDCASKDTVGDHVSESRRMQRRVAGNEGVKQTCTSRRPLFNLCASRSGATPRSGRPGRAPMVLVCDRILENRTTTPRLVALSLCPSGQLFITSAHCWSRCQSAAAEDGTSVAGHLMRVPCVKESSKSAVLLTHGAGMMPAGTRDSPPRCNEPDQEAHQCTARARTHCPAPRPSCGS